MARLKDRKANAIVRVSEGLHRHGCLSFDVSHGSQEDQWQTRRRSNCPTFKP
jgi:hypothetical protein